MLITFEDARAQILREAKRLSAEPVNLLDAGGRVLAEPLIALIASPRFDNSAVDGYAVRSEGISDSVRLRVVGEAAAGGEQMPALGAGECVRIFTGAPIPPDADAVVMQEDVSPSGGFIQIGERVVAGDNIRKAGEDYRQGDPLLESGTLITPPVIGLLAANGMDEVAVLRKPRVAIVATGQEIIRPGMDLEPGQIFDSNTFSLKAAVEQLGCEAIRLSSIGDDLDLTIGILREADRCHADVVLTSGGVSVGDHDYVKEALRAIGVEERFWGVAMKPGKPAFFGVKGSRLYFGLPGNPVSSLITFHVLVRSALLALAGRTDLPRTWAARLQSKMKGTEDRAEFVRGQASLVEDKWVVQPMKGRGSHMLSGLAKANCLIHLPERQPDLGANDVVRISFLDWNP